MKNPVFSSRKIFLLYWVLWMVIIAIHSFIVYRYYEFTVPGPAIREALVFNVVFAGLGLGIWYAVLYNSFDKNNLVQVILTHFLIGAVFVNLWFWSSYGLYKVVNPLPEHQDLIRETFTWRVLTGTFYYVIMVLIYYIVMSLQIVQQQKAREAELSSLIREAELNNLKSQLNPHFIFNSLNSIASLTLRQPEQARNMIVQLSDFLRYSLKRDDEDELVKLSEELAHIEKYMSIEKIRFGERLKVDFHNEIASERYRVPAFILQPLFENAIKHGVYRSLAPVKIDVSIQAKESELVISVCNNFDPEEVGTSGPGIGLENIRNRMSLIYGAQNLMKTEKQKDTFYVELTFPQQQ